MYNLALQNTTRALAGRQVLNHPTAPRSLQRRSANIDWCAGYLMRSEELGISGQGALTALCVEPVRAARSGQII